MNIGFEIFKAQNRILGYMLPDRTAKKAADLFLTPRKHPLKPWESTKEAEGKRILLDGGLSAIAWGNAKRQILLVHGWESRATQLAGFVDSLVALGFKVIALDAPAHGQSAGKQSNPVQFAEAVMQINQQLGPFDGIVGHSMGGSAVGLALSQGVECGKVVLISSPSSIISVLKRFAHFIGLPGKCAQRFIQQVELNVGRPANELNIAERLSALKSKGLIIHDKGDMEVPFRDAESLSRTWKNASLLATEGYGHRAIVRQPLVWDKVTEFLAHS
ncbi:MAG: alpha/beta hydrolase [Hahellaceae bacterium]|nr:alpha/beta hydrolase [Hahellaceae bacterium]MCP5170389.1 alpha/beta hydrolase [Hahellaceae bacterium]